MTWLDQYEEWSKLRSPDVPGHVHRTIGVGVLSGAIGFRVQLDAGYRLVHPNIWIYLQGPSCSGKSAVMRRGLELLESSVMGAKMADSASQLGLLRNLLARNGQPSVLFSDPATRFFKEVMREGGGDSLQADMYAKLYDGDSYTHLVEDDRRKLPGQDATGYFVTAPNFMIWANGTSETMGRVITRDHLLSGFLSRFVMVTIPNTVPAVTVTSDQGDRQVVDLGLMNSLWQNIEDCVSFLDDYDTLRIGLSREGLDTINKYENQLSQRYFSNRRSSKLIADIYNAVHGFTHNSVMKTCALLAAIENSPRVESRHALEAIELGWHWHRDADDVLGRILYTVRPNKATSWDMLIDKALKILSEEEPKSEDGYVKDTAIMVKIGVSIEQMLSIAAEMERRGLISIKHTPIERGKYIAKRELSESYSRIPLFGQDPNVGWGHYAEKDK